MQEIYISCKTELGKHYILFIWAAINVNKIIQYLKWNIIINWLLLGQILGGIRRENKLYHITYSKTY